MGKSLKSNPDFVFHNTIPPAIRFIHAQKRGMPLLSGLKFHVYIFIRTFSMYGVFFFLWV
jgi:hypothetical protein